MQVKALCLVSLLSGTSLGAAITPRQSGELGIDVLSKRVEPPPPGCTCKTRLLGNGDPHQNYYDKQVVDTVSNCEGVTCTTTKTEGSSFSWGINFNLAPKDSWINGGFNVGESYESGEAEGCSATGTSAVCLWFSQAYTAYTVVDDCVGQCGSRGGLGINKRVMMSPNNNNDGGKGYYCVTGSGCRTKNAGYWDTTGPAGGPP